MNVSVSCAYTQGKREQFSGFNRTLDAINNVFRKFSAFHDETGRLNVDGMNIISNDGSNKLNRSRKRSEERFSRNAEPLFRSCRTFSAFHDDTGRLNVDGINIISNDRSNKHNQSKKRSEERFSRNAEPLFRSFRKFSAFHDETGRLNVDGMNIISNDGSNKLNRSRKARVSYKVQRTINASLNAATSTRAVSSNPNFVTRQKIEIIFG